MPRSLHVSVIVLAAWMLAPPSAFPADDNFCDEPGDRPDLVPASIYSPTRHGTVDGITAYSLSVIACNLGSCWINWDNATNQHPVIGQNFFRLKDGRFEQLGQSWLKHGFNANSFDFCSDECIATDGKHLGVNCSDTYTSSLNGRQNLLGPKFEINPATGDHPHPVTDQELIGNAIYKRLQVKNVDLDPTLNPGASYYGELQYVTADEAPVNGGNPNVAHREALVSGQQGLFTISFDFDEPTLPGPAIAAWAAADSGVQLVEVGVPDDGRFFVAARATDRGGGIWSYEYAVQNFDSHRAAGSFRVPIHPATAVSNAGFHDVDYHSGEPFDLTDWPSSVAGAELRWATASFDVNPNANALRWGTLYNFRFDADAPPVDSLVTLELFRPGSPAEIVIPILGPRVCLADASCDAGETSCNCAADCGTPPADEAACGDGIDEDCDGAIDCADTSCCGSKSCPETDADGDGYVPCADCDDTSSAVWSLSGEALDLRLTRVPEGTSLTWSPPAQPGADAVTYEVLRSVAPPSFLQNTTCLVGHDPSLTMLIDSDPDPDPGLLFAYLVRARNGCPGGEGSLGTASNGVPRVGLSCP